MISPLMRMRPTGAEVPGEGALAFTSGRAVEAAGDLTGRLAYCVGDRTAEAARAAGAQAISVSGDVEALFTRLCDDRPALVTHLRGDHTRGDLAPRLRAAGIPASSVEVYRTEDMPLTPSARALLNGSDEVIAPVFSPRSAALLALAEATAPLTILAISQAAARPMMGKGAIVVADRPDADTLARMVAARFGNLS